MNKSKMLEVASIAITGVSALASIGAAIIGGMKQKETIAEETRKAVAEFMKNK